MDSGVFVPTLLIVSLSLATVGQLHDIAQDASEKTVKFADDATAALDCAYTARPLDECSPDLFSNDFKAEADRTRAILDDLATQQSGPSKGPKDKPRPA